MFRLSYVAGAQPGVKRKVETTEADKPNPKQPQATLSSTHMAPKKSTNAVRKFQASWQIGRPWPSYNHETQKMYCSLCTGMEMLNQ